MEGSRSGAPFGSSQLNHHHHLALSFPFLRASKPNSLAFYSNNNQQTKLEGKGIETDWIRREFTNKLKKHQECMHLTKNGCKVPPNPNPSMVLDKDFPVSNVTSSSSPSEGLKAVGCSSRRGGPGPDPLLASSRKRKAADEEKYLTTTKDIEKFRLGDDDDEESEEQEQPNMTEDNRVCHRIQQCCWVSRNPMSENPHSVISIDELLQNSGDVPVLGQSRSSSGWGGGRDLAFKRQRTEQQVGKEKEIIMLDSDSEDEEECTLINHQQQQREEELNNIVNNGEPSEPADMRSLDDERDWRFLQEEIWIANEIIKHQQPGIWFD